MKNFNRAATSLLATAVLFGCSDSTNPNALIPCTDEPGEICTWAGDGSPGWDGDDNGLRQSSLYWPMDITFTPSGDTYIVDWQNHRIRQVTPSGTLKTVIGTYLVGDGPLPGSTENDLIAPGADALEISLNHPTELVPLPDGKLLLAAWHNHKLRRYDPATGLILVVCGAGSGFSGDGGPAKDALLKIPTQVVVASTGDIYVLDQGNRRVRKIDTNDIITTVVGTGEQGFSGDGGPPLLADLNFSEDSSNPSVAGAMAIDNQDRLYISDTLNNRIRRVDFGADRIETIAGNGDYDFSGDNGPAIQASFRNPRDIEIGPDGRLYVADEFNNRVRAIDLTTGVITTVAGNGAADFDGDGGPAIDAALNRPAGLNFDSQGRLYIVDTYNHRIRRVNL